MQGTSSYNYHAAKQKKIQVPFLENFEQTALKTHLRGDDYHTHMAMWRLMKCFLFRYLNKSQGKQFGLINRTLILYTEPDTQGFECFKSHLCQ